jgi:hypothetical protein
MSKLEKFMALVGLCGAGIFVLGCILDLSIVANIGIVVFFGSIVGGIIYTAINGYNPMDRWG